MQVGRKVVLALAGACAASTAQAACPAANQYNFGFGAQPVAALNYADTYTYTATSTALGTAAFTVGFTPNGINAATTIGTLPEISAEVNGGTGGNALIMGGTWPGRTADIMSNTRVLVTTFTFPTPVRDVTFTVFDIDWGNNSFRDWIRFVGVDGAATYVPTLTTPFGQANGAGPYAATGSSVKLGPQPAPLAVAAPEAIGMSANANTTNGGNITVSFAQPVRSVQVRYANYAFQTGENTTGQQFYGVSGVSWCPLPNISATKTSAAWSDPVNARANPKAIPGGDVIYSLTITNTGGSPVDLSSTVLRDVLPANLTFYNGDMDDAGAGTANYEFVPGASGLTLPASGLTYFSDATLATPRTPTVGYDAGVRALRIQPTGSMAANSSFTVRFRARVN